MALLVVTIGLERKSGRARLVLSLKVNPFAIQLFYLWRSTGFRSFGRLPASTSSIWPLPSMLMLICRYKDVVQPSCSHQIRASQFSVPVSHSTSSQEPRKSDAPQLRDEFRSYRTLNGTRKSVRVLRFNCSHTVGNSGSPSSSSLWSGGPSQRPRH